MHLLCKVFAQPYHSVQFISTHLGYSMLPEGQADSVCGNKVLACFTAAVLSSPPLMEWRSTPFSATAAVVPCGWDATVRMQSTMHIHVLFRAWLHEYQHISKSFIYWKDNAVLCTGTSLNGIVLNCRLVSLYVLFQALSMNVQIEYDMVRYMTARFNVCVVHVVCKWPRFLVKKYANIIKCEPRNFWCSVRRRSTAAAGRQEYVPSLHLSITSLS